MSSIRRLARMPRTFLFLAVPLALAACSVKFDPNGVMSNGLTNEGAGAIPAGQAAPARYDYSRNGITGFLPPSRLGVRQVGPRVVDNTGFFAPKDVPHQPASHASPAIHRSLPGSAPVLANTSKRRMIMVKPGDTLVSIAFLTGSTVNDLKQVNDLADRRVVPGQQLLLP